MSLNRIVIMGRFVKDPEIRNTQQGTAVASFTLACDRDFKGKNGEKETDWLDVVAWRNTAEFVGKYFSKGRMAVVEGRLQTRQFEDRNGNKRKAVEIVAENVYFGDSKKETSEVAQDVDQIAVPSNYAELEDDDLALPF